MEGISHEFSHEPNYSEDLPKNSRCLKEINFLYQIYHTSTFPSHGDPKRMAGTSARARSDSPCPIVMRGVSRNTMRARNFAG